MKCKLCEKDFFEVYRIEYHNTGKHSSIFCRKCILDVFKREDTCKGCGVKNVALYDYSTQVLCEKCFLEKARYEV